MSVVPPTFPQLVGRAEQIVQIQVTATHAQWDVAPNGQRVIHTYVECRVEHVLKGTAGADLELRFLGGDVGSDHLVVSDMPKLEVGGEYVVFVAQNQRAFCPLVNVMHGAYRVLRDTATGDARVARLDGNPLRTVDDVQMPFAAGPAAGMGMRVSDFRTAIAIQQATNLRQNAN